MSKIPKTFKLFGTTIDVVFNDKEMNDRNCMGESAYAQSKITLTSTAGINKISDDKIMDTFYHEKIHMILETLGYSEISKDEKFVDLFAKALRQSDITAEYK